MINKVFDHIIENSLTSAGDTVVCGLSGGADSTALLLVMCSLSQRLGISVEAVHVNHCLRGDESDRDERFCRALCDRLKVPFTAVSCDVKAYAAEHGVSTEEAARKLRYGIFADASKGKKLATAHNAGDNLETVLLNLIRGSAVKGLAGIPPKRDNIIRPLLTVTRDEIEVFLAAQGQDYVTDSTNLSDDYTRNKIRHRLIPMMQEINPSVIETSVKATAAVRSENSLIDSLADEAEDKCRTGNKLADIGSFHEVIRRRCIARLLTENGLPYSAERLGEADNILQKGGKLNISGNMYLIGKDGSLELTEICTAEQEEDRSAVLKIGDNSIYPDYILNCEIMQCDNLKKFDSVHKKLTYYLIDYDKIKGEAILRSRRFGDRIKLPKRNFCSSVKKLINETVPKEKRSSMHFISDEEGTVFAEYIGVAERVVPDAYTRTLLKITVRRK